MEPAIVASIFPQWAQDLSTGLSLIGFFITVYVLVEVRRIKSAFLARARLPDLIKELSKAGSALNTHLGQWEKQRNEARGQIKIAAALIKSALVMLPKPEKIALTLIHKKLVDAAQDFPDEKYSNIDAGWDLYSDIQSCITSLNQVTKNMKWE
jgi:hypothetical protein